MAVTAGIAAVVLSAPTSGAAGVGVNAVKPAATDSHAQTGMGPGWVMASYKANGPMVGYLFAEGFTFADGTRKPGPDHTDVRGIAEGSAGNTDGITRWPWGYSGGSFDGCAYIYGTRKLGLKRTGFSSTRCANGPSFPGSARPGGAPDALRWWHSEQVFCTTVDGRPRDNLCNQYGVWSTNKGGGLKATTPRAECPVYGNIGAAAVYGADGAAIPRHRLGTVPVIDPKTGAPSRIDVRYVTKDRQWVMAKWNDNRFVAGIAWGFFPRGCLN